MREIFEVPVIFVTSYSDDATVERIRATVPGAPVYTERLADAIAEASRRGASTH